VETGFPKKIMLNQKNLKRKPTLVRQASGLSRTTRQSDKQRLISAVAI
jgi:hypothetical protein